MNKTINIELTFSGWSSKRSLCTAVLSPKKKRLYTVYSKCHSPFFQVAFVFYAAAEAETY